MKAFDREAQMPHCGRVTQDEIVVITNPASGHNRKTLEAVNRRFSAFPGLLHHVTRSPAEAEALVQRLRQDSPRVLVINGGDGTAARLFGMVLRHWPEQERPYLMVLPGGTANMTAGDIGISASHAKAVRQFCEWLEAGGPLHQAPLPRYVLKVTAPPEDEAHYGMFLGAGVIVRGTDYAQESVHSRGLVGELSMGLTLARILWGLLRGDPRFDASVRLSFRMDNATTGWREQCGRVERMDQQALVAAISTLRRLFLGIRPFWAPGRGGLGMTVIRVGASRFLLTFVSIIRGRPNRHADPANGYESFRSDKLNFWLDGRINLDGELISASREHGPVTVTTEGPLHFLQLR